MSRDLTKGSIAKSILIFSIPIFIGLIVQQFYSIVDGIVAGHIYGEAAIAAVGTTSSINSLIINLGAGATAGFSIVISQKFGAKNFDGMRKSIGNSITLTLIIGAILTALAVSFAKPILHLISVPENIFDDAYSYVLPIYIGIILTLGYNLATSMLRAIGNSLTPLLILIGASLINLGLDALFLAVFKMGVKGTGWATLISQGLACIVTFIYAFCKYKMLRVSFKDLKLEKKESLNQLSYALPMGFQYSITSIGMIAVQRLINSFSVEEPALIAAFSTCGKIQGVLVTPIWGMGTVMAAYAGQNYGARDYDRLVKGIKFGLIFNAAYAIFCSVVLILVGRYFLHIFVTDPSPNLIKYANEYFYIVPPFYVFVSIILVLRNSIQGMKDKLFPMLGGVLELASRIAISFLLVKAISYYAAYVADPITWFVASIFFIIRTKIYMKKVKKELVDDLNSKELANPTS